MKCPNLERELNISVIFLTMPEVQCWFDNSLCFPLMLVAESQRLSSIILFVLKTLFIGTFRNTILTAVETALTVTLPSTKSTQYIMQTILDTEKKFDFCNVSENMYPQAYWQIQIHIVWKNNWKNEQLCFVLKKREKTIVKLPKSEAKSAIHVSRWFVWNKELYNLVWRQVLKSL